MKIDRLIGIITILLQQDKATAPELAERFEVSRRTINRDIEDLCRAGIPICTTQGSGGGIAILDGYRIDKALLTHDELQAILSGLKGVDSVSARPYFNRLTEKLSSKAGRIEYDDVILIDLASHYQAPLTRKLELIKTAAKGRRYITFKYYYKKGECVRCIEPYRLVFRWSSWYVLGYCCEKEDFRLFKLNRLWDITLSNENFIPREIPESALQFDSWFSDETIHLKAVFDGSEKYRLIEEYGVDCFSLTGDGRLLFEREFADYENLRSWIFSFGDRVTVFEPERLISDRLEAAENILRNEGR